MYEAINKKITTIFISFLLFTTTKEAMSEEHNIESSPNINTEYKDINRICLSVECEKDAQKIQKPFGNCPNIGQCITPFGEMGENTVDEFGSGLELNATTGDGAKFPRRNLLR